MHTPGRQEPLMSLYTALYFFFFLKTGCESTVEIFLISLMIEIESSAGLFEEET